MKREKERDALLVFYEIRDTLHEIRGFMKTVERETERFRAFLRGNKIRESRGRKLILREAVSSEGHFTAEEMVKKCREKKYPVSRATVYRTLHLLKESGIIRETAYGEKHLHYEYARSKEHHHHARCLKCKRIIEFFCHERNLESENALNKKNFHIIGHELHFYGICNECQKMEDRGQKTE